MYRNLASSERVTLNLSGGGDICKYYVSGGFYNEGSIFRNAGDVYDYNSSIHYTKFNFRANMDFSVTPTTTFNVNLANIYESSWGPGATTSDIWGYALTPLQMHFLWNILMVLFLHQVQPVVVIHGICWYIPVIVSKVGIQPNH